MCTAPNIMNHGEFLGGLKFVQKKKGEQWLKLALASGDAQMIPCGQCLQCRIEYARAWAARCECESKYHEHSYFITCTYDDDHVPVHNMIEDSYYKGIVNPVAYVKGQTIERLTLCKKDHQDFLKRLRDHGKRKSLLEDNFKFYMCGEYGDKYGRPHFHYILFGIEIPDLIYKYSKNGYDHYTSELLQRIWGQGLVDVGAVSYLSCQYVARYVVKKRKGHGAKEYYEKAGIAPEFVQMSLKPGVGMQYWEEHRDEIYSLDKIQLESGRTVKPPRYFDTQEDRVQMEYEGYLQEIGDMIDCEESLPKMESGFMKEIKRERRSRAMDKLWGELKKTSLDMTSYYEAKGQNFEANHQRAKIRGRVEENE